MITLDGRTTQSISNSISNKIFTRDNGTCIYCDNPASEIDHVVNFAYGGPTKSCNLVCSCKMCNDKKAQATGNNEVAYIAYGLQYLARLGEDVSFVDKLYICQTKQPQSQPETLQIC